MDGDKRRMLEEHLAQAERHVAAGEPLLRKQRALVEKDRRRGLDVGPSLDLLASLEEIQSLHVAGRDRLRQELADAESKA